MRPRLIMLAEQQGVKPQVARFRIGDLVRVAVKVVDGESERLQAFEGIVIARKGTGLTERITVRKVSFGVGVERIFPLHSPRVARIEVVREGRSRRAKLYYLRRLSGKAGRIEERTSGGDEVQKTQAVL